MTRAERREQLRADVAVMRELGVLRWGVIVLGPEPVLVAQPLTDEQRRELDAARARREHDTRFAAVPVRPRFDDFNVAPRVSPLRRSGSGT